MKDKMKNKTKRRDCLGQISPMKKWNIPTSFRGSDIALPNASPSMAVLHDSLSTQKESDLL
jgi:hypothetical protein